MEPDDFPPYLTTEPHIVSKKVAWIMATLILIGSGSAGLGIYALEAWGFHFQDNAPVRDQPHYHEFLMLLPLAVTVAVLFGKYLWLFMLAPFATSADVSPWIAYGLPRRIHSLDKAFLKRFYKQ